MKFLLNCRQHSLHYDLHGFMVSYVGNFGYHDVEQLAKRSVVFVVSLGDCQKHIAGEHQSYMCSKAIIGKAVILLTKQQAAFAGLEKHFDIPAMAVDADDVILAEPHSLKQKDFCYLG